MNEPRPMKHVSSLHSGKPLLSLILIIPIALTHRAAGDEPTAPPVTTSVAPKAPDAPEPPKPQLPPPTAASPRSDEELDRQAAEIERAQKEQDAAEAKARADHEAAREAARMAEEQRREVEQRHRNEEQQRAVEAQERRTRGRGQRRAGYVLGALGLAMGAVAVAPYLAAGNLQTSIRDGNLATAADITNAGSQARIYQGLSYSLWGVGGAVLLTGIIVLATAPSPQTNVTAAALWPSLVARSQGGVRW